MKYLQHFSIDYKLLGLSPRQQKKGAIIIYLSLNIFKFIEYCYKYTMQKR